MPIYEQLTQQWQPDDEKEIRNLGWAWTRLGSTYRSLGQYRAAIKAHEQAQQLFLRIGDRGGEAASLGSLGNAYQSLGQYQRAIEFHQQSLDIKREIGDRGGEAKSLGNLGNAYQSLGQYQRAIEFHQQSLDIAREIGDRRGEAISFFNLGNALAKLDQPWEARQKIEQAKQIYTSLNLDFEVEDCDTALYQLNQIIAANPIHAPTLQREPPALPDWYVKSLPTPSRSASPRKTTHQPFWVYFLVGLAIVFLIWWLKH